MSIQSFPLGADFDLFSLQELDENGSALINSSLLSFSEEHITDESSTHDDNEDQGTGQKRSSPRRALRGEYYRSLSFTFKRLVKTDIRRIFPSMYCNVLNGDDCQLVQNFLCRYMIPTCKISCEAISELGSPLSYYQGPLEHAKHVLTLAEALPDHSLILLGCRIIRYLYKEVSVIEMYAAAKATRLIYPNDDEGEAVIYPPVVNEVSVEVQLRSSFFFNGQGHIIKAKGVIANNIPSFR